MSAELRAMRGLGIPEMDTRAFKKEGGQIKAYWIGGGGSSAPTQQNVTTTSIAPYAQPYVEDTLGRAQALTTQTPYESYGGQRIAGFSPMEAQAFQNIAGQQVASQIADASNAAYTGGQQALGYGQLASNIGQAGMANAQAAQSAAEGKADLYGGMGANLGQQAVSLTPEAQRYGASGAGIGSQATALAPEAQGYGALGTAFGAQAAGMSGLGYGAQGAYERMATSPSSMQAYMSPYMQNVVDVQKQEAIRDADIQRQKNQAMAVQSGAYGGSRQGIVESEAQRNLATELGRIQALGSQQAFQNAQQAQQFGSTLGIQGLQAGTQAQLAGVQGAQAGLQGLGQAANLYGVGLQGAQVGLQGVNQAGQLYGLGMQGAGLGLQGTGQRIAAGQLGLQGAQLGLSGQQAGIGGAQAATNAASTLGNLGQTQFGQQTAITQAMANAGAQQRGMQQAGLDVAYQDFLNQQQHPYQQLAYMQGIYSGLPMAQQTQALYGAQAPLGQQLAGYGLSGLAAYKAFS